MHNLMTKSPSTHCESCGQPYPEGAAAGICPRCLLQVGMETKVLSTESRDRISAQHREFLLDLFPELEGIRLIGRGGMGVVYRAHQHDLRRDIALKLLPLEHAGSPGWEARFEVEARAVARLDHPNIVTLYEFGERDGSPFLKMKLVEGGRSLADSLKEKPKWPVREAVTLITSVARAVHHAHQHGIIHRDIKPGNILLDESGEPYLTDFGLARFVEENTGLTGSHMLVGTANYMAPEQADGRGQDITTAVDVHALGAVLYEMLTGRPPFVGNSMAEILRGVCESEPVAPHVLRPEVDRDLSTICLKCLEKKPSRRYGSAESLVEELERWQEGRPILARPISAIGRVSKWARRKPGVAALVSLLVLTALAAITGFYVAWMIAERNRRIEEFNRKEAEGRLAQALGGFTSEAGAHRLKGKAGRRWDALAAIEKGVAIRVTPELRSESVACLSLVDVRRAERWRGEAEGLCPSAMSPDYTKNAQAQVDGSIELRSYPSLESVRTMPAQGQPVGNILKFSPDGRWLAAGYGNPGQQDLTLILWEVKTGSLHMRLDGVHLQAFDFSPDSRVFSIGTRSSLQSWNLESKSTMWNAKQDTEPYTVRFSPDGQSIAVSHSLGGVDLIDASNAKVRKSYVACDSSFGIAWDPKSRWLAIPSGDGMLFVWDTKNDTATARNWQAHNRAAVRAAWHPNGRLLVTEGADEDLFIWDARLGEKLVEFTAQSVGELAFSPNGRRLGLFRNSDQLSLMEVEDGGGIMRQSVGHERHQIHGASWHPSGLLLATAGEDSVKFWNREGEAVGTLPMSAAKSVIWTPDSMIVTGTHGIWSWPILEAPSMTGSRKLVLGHAKIIDDREGWERAALCSRESENPKDRIGHLLAVTHPDRILLIDLKSGKPPLEIHGQPNAAFASISPDEKWLATGARGGADVQIWSLPDGKPKLSLDNTGGANVLFSPDGSMLVTANSVEYGVWKTENWSLATSIPTHTGNYFAAMAFSPRMTALALESERNRIRIVSPETLEDLAAPDFDYQAPLTFSPEGVIMVDLDKKSHLIFWNLKELRSGMKSLGLDWTNLKEYPSLPVFPLVESVEFAP